MRIYLLLLGLTLAFSSFCQDGNKNRIIPFLCDNGKYSIADRSGKRFSDCIYDEMKISRTDITLAELNGEIIIVNKKGLQSTPILGEKYSAKAKVSRYKRLTDQERFYSYELNNNSYIYDTEEQKWHGPLTRPVMRHHSSLSYLSGTSMIDNPSPMVRYTKGENQYILSTSGKSVELKSMNANAYRMKGNFLIYYGEKDEKSIIYNLDLEEKIVADSIIHSRYTYNQDYSFLKDNKRYKLNFRTSNFMDPSAAIDSMNLGEIPLSYRWEVAGYVYHEDGDRKWVDDKDGKLHYTLQDGERVLQYLGNILLYRKRYKQLLLGDSSKKLFQPHLKIETIGQKYLLQDTLGEYYIMDRNGTQHNDEAYKDAHRVHNDWLLATYKNGKKALFNENLELLFFTEEDIVRIFKTDSYIYKSDSLYGLLDSVGNRLTDPISKQPKFYTSNPDWIKVHDGEPSKNRAYLYNLKTKRRTEGLSNEFRFLDKKFDEEGNPLISAHTYGIDSVYFYRLDGSIIKTVGRQQAQHYQKEKHRYTRKEISRNNYVFIDQLHSDTLLACTECDGMYLIDLNQENKVDFVICSYRNRKQDLYDNRGRRTLPEGHSLLRNSSHHNELQYYPQLVVQNLEGKIGIWDIEEEKAVIPITYNNVIRLTKDRLSLRNKGKSQITDLQGKPINDDFYFRMYALKNGDIAAQYPMEGTHKKKIYRDPNDPNMDPCKGKVIDAPNYFYKIIDRNGKSRYENKFLKFSYDNDDLISVEEWTGKDTIYYCMYAKGKKLQETAKGIKYKVYDDKIIERKNGNLSMLVNKNLKPLIDREFKDFGKHEKSKGKYFYYGYDEEHTYVYDEKFKETAKVKGNCHLSRFDTTMLLLYDNNYRDIYLLDTEGKLFYDKALKKAGYNHDNGIQEYEKDGKSVFVDMLYPRLFWE